jgi:hypothetical protein
MYKCTTAKALKSAPKLQIILNGKLIKPASFWNSAINIKISNNFIREKINSAKVRPFHTTRSNRGFFDDVHKVGAPPAYDIERTRVSIILF